MESLPYGCDSADHSAVDRHLAEESVHKTNKSNSSDEFQSVKIQIRAPAQPIRLGFDLNCRCEQETGGGSLGEVQRVVDTETLDLPVNSGCIGLDLASSDFSSIIHHRLVSFGLCKAVAKSGR